MKDRLRLLHACDIADRRLIDTVHAAWNRPTLVRVAQRSRQFLLRLQDAIVSGVDAPNVFRAARMQNRHAADRRVVRRGIAVARQVNPIVLFRQSVGLMRKGIDDNVNDLLPGDVRLPVGIGAVLVGLVHGGFHAGHQLIEDRSEISHHAVRENVVSDIAGFHSARVVVDEGVILDQIVQFDLGIATNATGKGVNEHALDERRVLVDERIAVQLVVTVEDVAQRQERGEIILDLQNAV